MPAGDRQIRQLTDAHRREALYTGSVSWVAEASAEPLSLARVAVVGARAKPLAPKMAGQRQLELTVVGW